MVRLSGGVLVTPSIAPPQSGTGHGLLNFSTAPAYHKKNGPLFFTPMARRGFHDNLDVASEPGEAVQQAVLRNPAKVSPQERGHLRLGQTQQIPRLRLRQALALDEFGDLGHELSLDKHGLRIRHAEISIDVSAAHLDLDRMIGFTFPHVATPLPPPLPLSIACESNRSHASGFRSPSWLSSETHATQTRLR